MVYAMLDTQSDTTFILDSVAESLNVCGNTVSLKLSTLHGEAVIPSNRYNDLEIRGAGCDTAVSLRQCYGRPVMPCNVAAIPTNENVKCVPEFSSLPLSEFKDIPVGLLIGYDNPSALEPLEVVKASCGAYAQRTTLGWAIVGPSGKCKEEGSTSLVGKTSTSEVDPERIVQLLERDFRDTPSHECAGLSQRDAAFMKIMNEKTRVLPDRHLELPLPLQGGEGLLKNNRQSALRRLMSLKQRLDRDGNYRAAYQKFMSEMMTLGHAEKAPPLSKNAAVWYIPHHGVYHPTKKKLRVVFDCSTQLDGIGLNDVLLQGPDLTNNLVGVLVRFGLEPVALICDIAKMFYQFKVPVSQRDVMRFLWWPNGDTTLPVTECRMTVHVFGAKSSPAVANYGLKRTAQDRKKRYPDAVTRFIEESFYVDDGLLSVSTESEAINILTGAIALCAETGLRLHKVVSNSRAVLSSVKPEDRSISPTIDLADAAEELPTERALGVVWDVQNDVYRFNVKPSSRPPTRRIILSSVSSVFDPLGFVAPFVLTGRLILRDMCAEAAPTGKAAWDDPVNEEIHARWAKWAGDSSALQYMKIPRCVKPEGFRTSIQSLHAFSDASERGYGSVIYLKRIDCNGNACVQFLIGKARVVSLKHVTIPRLELMAALLSVRLIEKMRQELRLRDVSVTPAYYHTDSMVVLGYIFSESARFKTFVANRIQQILNVTTTSQWRFCPGNLNPADYASRGLTAESMVKCGAWLQGPSFLVTRDQATQETVTSPVLNDTDPELKKSTAHVTQVEPSVLLDCIIDVTRFSRWGKLLNVMALVIKFTQILLNRVRKHETIDKITEKLNVAAVATAEVYLLRYAQRDLFPDVIKQLTAERGVTNPAVARLCPYLDHNHVIRVGGRLHHADVPERERHPYLLARGHHMSLLVVRWAHESSAHQGRSTTINATRQAGYWILGMSTLVSAVIHKCVICRKLRGTATPPQMAALPEDRGTPSPPFSYVGTDLFGPFVVSEGRRTVKRWGVLFTCLYCRAVHIETASDISTDAIINAIRRFKAVRGPIRLLRCDKGTNYTGMVSELTKAFNEIDDDKLREFLLTVGCDLEVTFNTAAAPHTGGVWERLIQTTKRVLAGIMENVKTSLSDESLRTFLYEVAAIINGRPLTATAVLDPTSPMPLTPNMILTGKVRPLLPPPGSFNESDVMRRKRWRQLQRLLDIFWRRFRVEYLQSLQARSKWVGRTPDTRVGDVVIIRDVTPLRNVWQLARVVSVNPSSDHVVRSVKLQLADATALDERGRRRTSLSILERPVTKLVTLVRTGNSPTVEPL